MYMTCESIELLSSWSHFDGEFGLTEEIEIQSFPLPGAAPIELGDGFFLANPYKKASISRKNETTVGLYIRVLKTRTNRPVMRTGGDKVLEAIIPVTDEQFELLKRCAIEGRMVNSLFIGLGLNDLKAALTDKAKDSLPIERFSFKVGEAADIDTIYDKKDYIALQRRKGLVEKKDHFLLIVYKSLILAVVLKILFVL